jgi:hypothetical protein
MRLDVQVRVTELVEAALRRRVYSGPTPDWLYRPGRAEIGVAWRRIRLIYRRLTDGLELPDRMPVRESRNVDGIIGGRGLPWRVLEVDERQHFNEFRAITLELYPTDVKVGFPLKDWLRESGRRKARAGGGWGARKPPLFPMSGGRHRQRAFRDALADLLPPIHDYAPTLRIAAFEVEPWMDARGAVTKMRALLEERMADKPGIGDG